MTLQEAVQDAREKRGVKGRFGIVPMPLRVVAAATGVGLGVVHRVAMGKNVNVADAVKLAKWAGVRMEDVTWA